MAETLTDKEIQHLYWRAGFGITYSELVTISGQSKTKIVQGLFAKSKKEQLLQLDLSMLQQDAKNASKEEKKNFRKLRNEKLLELNQQWFQQMKTTEGVLRERMTLFFQNHFSVQIRDPRFMQPLHNTIRKNALGNFGELLVQVSKTPAMLRFLNAKQNRKGRPNENFAREVMELFTLGRDNGYTEKDIKEAARAFTGWSFNKQGAFVFRAKTHDVGVKTVLGNTGNFDGEAVLKILLKEKQTARYLSLKLYKYLINETPDMTNVELMANAFYEANYDIKTWLETVFMSNWFYATKNIGTKIKSPVDLITGLSRQFDVRYTKPKTMLFIQRQLNQILFYPPNVAGWPGGKYWIDSSTLMIRLKLPSVVLNGGVIDISVKEDMPENMLMIQNKVQQKKKRGIEKRIGATVQWESVLAAAKDRKKEEITTFFIQPELSVAAKRIVEKSAHVDTKNFIVELLSLPEYQLC